MVTFMEKMHKRESDGLFVHKRSEHISDGCRELEEEKLTQMMQGEETYSISSKQINFNNFISSLVYRRLM